MWYRGLWNGEVKGTDWKRKGNENRERKKKGNEHCIPQKAITTHYNNMVSVE
jgi:hypothetical protein